MTCDRELRYQTVDSLARDVRAFLTGDAVVAYRESPAERLGRTLRRHRSQVRVGIGVALPGATAAEERANWVWQMRSAMNLAALQCKFDRTLLASDIYSGVLRNHQGELGAAYDTLRGYFKRTTKTPKAAQDALDKYGTKTYSAFSTVTSQYGFCQTASRIGKKALFAPRGGFTIFTVERLRELRNSLIPGGEQYFRRTRVDFVAANLDDACWDRRGRYIMRCGFIY